MDLDQQDLSDVMHSLRLKALEIDELVNNVSKLTDNLNTRSHRSPISTTLGLKSNFNRDNF